MSSASSSPAVGYSTLVDLLRSRAFETPEQVVYTFLKDGEVEDGRLTCAGLDAQARAIAAWLQSEGLAGERALLLHPPGLDFIAAFFGCLYAGVIAVPAYPPRPNRPDPRIQQIFADSQASAALTTSAALTALEGRLKVRPGESPLRWLATDRVGSDHADRWREPEIDADTVAFLQYTSGSTVAPKGVMVSHANLLGNSADLDRALQHDEGSVLVSWLPHFHDMGLIYGIIQPMYKGFSCVLMPPASFLQRPRRWLQAISDYKATHSGGPNFAYDLCTTRITPDERAAMDLSCWRMAFNGAEPVRQATLERFAEAFAASGFRREALSPGYGMAEATLMIAASRQNLAPVFYRARADELDRNRLALASEDDITARMLVGCGRPEGVSRVVIVNPQTCRPCGPSEVGEIWVSGPSVARGYWNRPEETVSTFRAFLGDSDGPYLRTGDLGFLSDGELFVTGRLKDLIIVRGLNHYPQDIEQTVERSHPALRPVAGAAFSIEIDGEERLVVVQEVDRQHRSPDVEEIMGAVRRAVTEQHEVEPHAVVLIRYATILKTSSGKIQRRACRAAFLEGRLSVVGEWRKPAGTEPGRDVTAADGSRSVSDITGWLVARLAHESGMDAEELDLGQPFASFGLDSARSLLLVGDLEAWLGRRLSPVVLWNYPTVEALARHLGR